MQRNLRIACFSQNYPPLLDSEAYVTAKWVRAMRDDGHNVEVFSGNATPVGHLQPVSLGATLLRYFFQIQHRRTLDLTQLERLHLFVSNAVDRFSHAHREAPFDVLVSRYEPIGSAIAAYWCRRTARVPWIASYNDPIPRLVTPRKSIAGIWDAHRNQFQTGWTEHLLSTPDALVFPCDALRQFIVGRRTSPRKKVKQLPSVFIIPHIGGAIDANTPPPTTDRKNKSPVFRHVGYLSSARSTATLLNALRMWESSPACGRLRLEFIGRISGQHELLAYCREKRAGKVDVSLLPEVSQAAAMNLIAEATGTILIESSLEDSIYLPSKFCDYATMKKPILAITSGSSTVSRFLNQYGGGAARPHGDIHGVFIALQSIVSGQIQASAKLAHEFSPARNAHEWRQMLSSVICKHSLHSETVTQHRTVGCCPSGCEASQIS
jgi:hypothetical protein